VQGPSGGPNAAAGVDVATCTYASQEDAHYYSARTGAGTQTSPYITEIYRLDRATRRRRQIASVPVTGRETAGPMAAYVDPRDGARLVVFDVAQGDRLEPVAAPKLFDATSAAPMIAPLKTFAPSRPAAFSSFQPMAATECGRLASGGPTYANASSPAICVLGALPGGATALVIWTEQGGASSWRVTSAGSAADNLAGIWFDHATGRFLATGPDDPSIAVLSFTAPGGLLTQVGTDRFLPNGGASCLAYDPNRTAIYAGGVESEFDLAAF
jgi:hypothetical protein